MDKGLSQKGALMRAKSRAAAKTAFFAAESSNAKTDDTHINTSTPPESPGLFTVGSWKPWTVCLKVNKTGFLCRKRKRKSKSGGALRTQKPPAGHRKSL